MMGNLHVTPEISIRDDEIKFEFVRSSGPGGQNVNKVATAVQLRFDARRTTSLPDDVRERLMKLAGRRLTDDGVIVIHARRKRTQGANRKDALDRLLELIRQAAKKPEPRRKTKPTRASVERRIGEKRQQSRIKRRRKPVQEDDD